MKELKLDGGGFLVDAGGLKFKRERPVASIECKMTSRNFPIYPVYFAEQIQDLKKKGKLREGLNYGYLVADRRETDTVETVQKIFGSVECRYLEVCRIELYQLAE